MDGLNYIVAFENAFLLQHQEGTFSVTQYEWQSSSSNERKT